MDSSAVRVDNPYALLLLALRLIPLSHYLLAFLLSFSIFLYNFLELHFIEDLLSGFRGCPVSLTYNPSSQIYNGVVSKCRILHGRYLATPWLSSPHIQTVFLNFFGRPPAFSYKRELFHASDGGTIALDWLTKYDVADGGFHMNNSISRDDTTPIMVVIPGLTSDSQSAYLKHLAFSTAKSGWNVVVSNHRGLGGVSITSDCFYNAGWTEDIRVIINHLHHVYPNAPLFAVGTSIGANVLVKYLGEDGDNVPVAGAVAICSPWDLLIGDRFIRRRFVQTFYDRALTIGLQGYAQLHEPRYSRLANWEGIVKSRTIRDFDHHATRLVGKYETVDTYYRRCSSAGYVGNVSVPLLCVSALDDPVCTREAIPWDECRLNKNVVLATVKHGGHLAFFEGIAGARLWWVRATGEFLRVLHSSQYMHVQNKIANTGPQSSLDSTIDQGPFVSVAEDGMVAAMGNERKDDDTVEEVSEPQRSVHSEKTQMVSNTGLIDEQSTQQKSGFVPTIEQTSVQVTAVQDAKPVVATYSVKRCLDILRRQNRYSIWLLAYIAIISSWPFLGSALRVLSRKRLRNVLPAVLLRR
ncbi:hypothetical protein L484_016441 [Morus notabilis]|uniref:Serine aminopeptidase S33 domain-containing protein n=1 Tax=Morus notabilis TaxID=981085 RepID=W9RJZ6_9ROSA|nr:embryogenesis-associated protein EMB8 [Morus notabilis]EXB57388.1 hypothetical protein L484_016441 [Morus notabilis]